MIGSKEHLADILDAIVANDQHYDTRYALITAALVVAAILRYPYGVRIDPENPEWAVVFIELPTGQVSWHLPQHIHPWDGHTTAEKFQRIAAYRAALTD